MAHQDGLSGKGLELVLQMLRPRNLLFILKAVFFREKEVPRTENF